MFLLLVGTIHAAEIGHTTLPVLGWLQGLIGVLGAIALWWLSIKFTQRRHQMVSSVCQVLSFVFLIFGCGAFFPGIVQQFLLIGLLIGVGWSMRELVVDLIAGVLIFGERKIFVGSWVSGPSFSGLVILRTWRYIGVQSEQGVKRVVPNREFLSNAIEVSTAGFYKMSLPFVIPSDMALRKAEEITRSWIVSSPWVSNDAIVLYPDSAQQNVLVIQVTLLRPDFKDDFMRALRWQLEEAKKRLQPL